MLLGVGTESRTSWELCNPWQLLACGTLLRRSAAKISRLIKNFSLVNFEKQAQERITDFFRLHATADLVGLKPMLTDQYYTAVRRGLEETQARIGKVESAEIVEVVAPARVRGMWW